MKLNDEWEEFGAGATERPANRIHVTLNRQSIILLNRNAHRLIGSPETVVLHFNRKRSKICIAATHRLNAKGFPVLPQGTTWRIQASPFCRHHEIKVAKTEKFI